MPTYTYRCQRCGEEIEAFQSMSDPPLKRCRSCRGALRRTFHPVGIVLKGSGFYKTDYASPKRTKENKDNKEKDSSSSSSSDPGKKASGSDKGETKKQSSGNASD